MPGHTQHPPLFAPLPILGGIIALLLLLAAATIHVATQIPRGEQLLHVDSDKLLIAEPSGPLEIVAVNSGQGSSIAVGATTLLEEPDLLSSYEAYNAFFDNQSRLASLLSSNNTVRLLTSDAETVETSVGQTALFELPAPFWVQLAVALCGCIFGIGVWSFRRGDAAAAHFGVSGIALVIVIFPAAIYSTRWLAMDGELFRLLSVIDHAGLYLLCASLVSLTWSFPSPLKSWPFAPVAYASMAIIWLLDTLQWLPSLDVSTRVVPISILTISMVLLVFHYRQTRNTPSQRVSANWFLLLVVGGSGLFVTLVFLPPLIGYPPLISQGMAFIAFLLIYLGMAAGVIRFRIFDLDAWWFHALLSIIGGIIFIALDIGFSLLLSISPTQSLWIALAIAGWLYFPLRQWIMNRFLQRGAFSIQQHLPQLVSIIAGSRTPEEAFEGWKSFMLQTFQPLKHEIEETSAYSDGISADALAMMIRSPDQHKTMLLHYAHQGRHIFTHHDLEIATAIRDLFAQALQAINSRDEATIDERNRIRRDIHDTLGGNILSILHHSKEAEIKALAQSAWREMREILAALDNRPQSIGDAIGRWRQSIDRQFESAGIEADWELSPLLGQLNLLPGHFLLQTGRILQEAVTNAVRHADPHKINIAMAVDTPGLCIKVCHDGSFSAPEEWCEGRGLIHMKQRATTLGGRLEHRAAGDELITTVTLPLPHGEDA